MHGRGQKDKNGVRILNELFCFDPNLVIDEETEDSLERIETDVNFDSLIKEIDLELEKAIKDGKDDGKSVET